MLGLTSSTIILVLLIVRNKYTLGNDVLILALLTERLINTIWRKNG